MHSLQEKFDNNNSYEFTLPYGQYEAPLIINKPCIINGNMSIIWGNKSPALIINSKDVIIRNLKISILENTKNKVAIKTNFSDTKFEDVEIDGDIDGIEDEDNWSLPAIINIGSFTSNKINTFQINMNIPKNAQLLNNIYGIDINLTNLLKGNNTIIIKTDEINDNISIYGEIIIKTIVNRKILIIGKSEKNILNNINNVININLFENNITKLEIPTEFIPPNVNTNNITYLKRGQRIPISQFKENIIKIIYEDKYKKENMDIDSYIFMLKEDGKVIDDKSLIFFGNENSTDNAINLITNDNKNISTIKLNNICDKINKISICYSIYGDNPLFDFFLVELPIIRIFIDNTELYRFNLDNLNKEKTIVAVEIYRYKDEWKLAVIGSGYNDGLKKLCESFGLEVE